ncbi:uncharacterized protein LOC130703048 isoform X2 [Daphnia carinata]|uniref:uncharacterized protein LOC130703048 isoform X2 n=1 Tax=Daphnia carinata TaxID=120202 RepID=UPI002868F7CD|nr:uncharacterized protein LOC130703048 isoform X2 [Daphnia carinata]
MHVSTGHSNSILLPVAQHFGNGKTFGKTQRLTVNLISIFQFCCFSLLLFGGHSETLQDNVTRVISSKKHLPLCVDNLLEQQEWNYSKWEKFFSNTPPSCSKIYRQSACKLLQYNAEHTVLCLDAINNQHCYRDYCRIKKKNTYRSVSNELHFVFMGDSRIRQQFFNFLKGI